MAQERYKWRRGDRHPDTGLLFWHYAGPKDVKGNWITDEQMAARKVKVKAYYTDQDAEKRNSRREYFKDYYLKNRDKVLTMTAEYYKDNKKAIRATKGRYAKKRRETDPLFAIQTRLRDRVRRLLRSSSYTATSGVYKTLGCSKPELLKWFESFFTPELHWGNMREWHIDHITPLCSAKNEEELIKLCHYTNLRPLLAHDNRKKGGRIL